MDSSGKQAGAPTTGSADPSVPSGSHLPQTAVVGVMVDSWGFRGEVRIQPLTDNPRRFAKDDRIMIAGSFYRVESSRWHRGMALVKLEGIETAEDAARLAGAEIEVPLDQVPPLPEGSYYHFQILDMEVWTSSGEHLGSVEDILSTGSNDVYLVRRGSEEVLVPAIDGVVLEVDVEGGRITVELPDGLR